MNTVEPLQKLVATPDQNRDDQWEIQFFHALSNGNLDIMSEEPQLGPDGWPYLLAQTNENSTESFQKVLHWLHEKGIGLVINPEKEFPDYIFTYGMIWFFKETGFFFKENGPLKEGVFEFQIKDIQSAGDPGRSYLPLYARKILKEFFNQQGILDPKILAFTLDGVNFELAFSLESLGNPNPTEHQGILEALGWFLPSHYQIALISESELPISFVSL